MQEALQVSPTIATPQQSRPTVPQQNGLTVSNQISNKFNSDAAESSAFIETKGKDAIRALGKVLFKKACQKKWEFFYKIVSKFNQLNNELIKVAELQDLAIALASL